MKFETPLVEGVGQLYYNFDDDLSRGLSEINVQSPRSGGGAMPISALGRSSMI